MLAEALRWVRNLAVCLAGAVGGFLAAAGCKPGMDWVPAFTLGGAVLAGVGLAWAVRPISGGGGRAEPGAAADTRPSSRSAEV